MNHILFSPVYFFCFVLIFYHVAHCMPKHVCAFVQVCVFRGCRQLRLLVLTLCLIRDGLCCFAAVYSSLACWWAFGDGPSASHLTLGALELQMCCHSWLCVGSWAQILVCMLSWQVLLATDSSPPCFVGEHLFREALLPLFSVFFTWEAVCCAVSSYFIFSVSLWKDSARTSQDLYLPTWIWSSSH